MGYTAILWELEDKIAWETCPECVSCEAFSKRSFRRILEYARSVGLENIPLLQTIGHAEYVLKHPKFHQWRENPEWSDCYCTSRMEVRNFLKKWIVEYVDLFDGDIGRFHLGGDEAYRFATCPECRTRAEDVGINKHYAEHLDDLASVLLQRNIVPAVWGDMLLANPEHIDDMPRHFQIWDWNYWDGVEPPGKTLVWGHGMLSRDEIEPRIQRQFPELLSEEGAIRPFHSAIFLKNRGWDVVLCGSTRAFGDSFFVGCHDVHAPNVVGVSQTVRREGMIGACVTSWGVRVHPWEVQYPSIQMAARAWNNPAIPFQQVESLSLEACLGALPVSLLEDLGRPFPFFRNRENGIQFNRLKDPVRAPDGYINSLLDGWRQNPETWNGIQREIVEGRDHMAVTISGLTEHLANGAPEPGVSAALLQAAKLQAHAVDIGAEVIRSANGVGSPLDGLAKSTAARIAMRDWAGNWMTPCHAELIGNLVFGSIDRYLKQSRTVSALH